MLIKLRWLWMAVFGTIWLLSGANAQDAAHDGRGFERLNVRGGKVLVVPLEYAFDADRVAAMVESLDAARTADQLHAVVLDVAPGFHVDEHMERLLRAVRRTSRELPVYLFVSERTNNAGTLLSLAVDAVFMAPGSIIGPVDAAWWLADDGDGEFDPATSERIMSEARARMRGLAQESGQNAELAMAFVDPSQVLKIGDAIIADEGQLLSLTAQEATRFYEAWGGELFATAIVNDVPALISYAGVTDAALLMPGADDLVEAQVTEVDGQRKPRVDAGAWEVEKLGLRGGVVQVIPLQGEVDMSLIILMRRAFREARRIPDLQAIVIHMDTPGGRVDLTKEIIDLMREARKSVPVYVFVDGWGASAGAIICLAADAVFMSPGSNLGSAMPITVAPGGGGVQQQDEDTQEKMMSHLRGYVRALAEENGYHPGVAEAFVDRSKRVVIGDTVVCEVGELLSLTADEAVKFYPALGRPLFASGIVSDVEELVQTVDIIGAEVRVVEVRGVEKLARWITMLAPILMIGFLLGFYTEINTPGFGLPGAIALVCLGIMLFGHYVAGLAGYEEMALIGLGIVLLVVELFVIPGFGFIGMIGLGCMLTGIVLVMIPRLKDIGDLPELPGSGTIEPYVQGALLNLAITLLFSILGFWLLARYLPRTGPFSKLVLQASQRAEDGYVGMDMVGSRALIGATGVALTDMRPSGMARVEGRRLDVVSAGDYIRKGDKIRITKVNGPRIEAIVVVDEPSGDDAATLDG